MHCSLFHGVHISKDNERYCVGASTCIAELRQRLSIRGTNVERHMMKVDVRGGMYKVIIGRCARYY